MNKGEEKKIHEILESGSIGYAYLFDAKEMCIRDRYGVLLKRRLI